MNTYQHLETFQGALFPLPFTTPNPAIITNHSPTLPSVANLESAGPNVSAKYGHIKTVFRWVFDVLATTLNLNCRCVPPSMRQSLK